MLSRAARRRPDRRGAGARSRADRPRSRHGPSTATPARGRPTPAPGPPAPRSSRGPRGRPPRPRCAGPGPAADTGTGTPDSSASATARALSLRISASEKTGSKSPSTARGATSRKSPLTDAAPLSMTVSTKTPGSSPAAAARASASAVAGVDDRQHLVVDHLDGGRRRRPSPTGTTRAATGASSVGEVRGLRGGPADRDGPATDGRRASEHRRVDVGDSSCPAHRAAWLRESAGPIVEVSTTSVGGASPAEQHVEHRRDHRRVGQGQDDGVHRLRQGGQRRRHLAPGGRSPRRGLRGGSCTTTCRSAARAAAIAPPIAPSPTTPTVPCGRDVTRGAPSPAR